MRQNGKDSNFAGAHPPASSWENFNGMKLPLGDASKDGRGGCNEYVVYNTNQARIRYVLRMKMN